MLSAAPAPRKENGPFLFVWQAPISVPIGHKLDVTRGLMTASHKMRQKTGRQSMEPPPLGCLYDVEGRHLFLTSPAPEVRPWCLRPGPVWSGLDYLNIHDQVSQFTTSVLYDRAGTGWSDQVALPPHRHRSHR